MKHCFAFDPSSLAPIEIRKIKGVDVKVSFSPYDVPERVCIDEEGQRGLVEFEYPGEESLVKKEINRYTILWVGEHSERIHRIEIDLQGVRNETSGISLSLFSAATAAIEAAKKAKSTLAKRYDLNQRGLEIAAGSLAPRVKLDDLAVVIDPQI